MRLDSVVLERSGGLLNGRLNGRPSAARRLTTVVIADEKPIRRGALASWLGADPSIEVIGLASRPQEAAAMVVDGQPATLLMYCDSPMHPFFEIASRVRRLSAKTVLILLSEEHNTRACRAAVACGAAHACLDDEPDEVLAVVRGRQTAQPGRCVPLDELPPTPPLSNRERDVLVNLAKGLSAKETASALGICPKTVDNHAQRLMRKLDLHSRADVVLFAVREGYVTP